MYKFIIYRGFEYFFTFLYVIFGYQILNVKQGVFFYDFVLITATLTFIFSNANNWLMKSEDQSAYLQFQCLVALLVCIVFAGSGMLEYVVYVPIILLKSFSIVQLRLDHRQLVIPKYSMLFGLLNLALLYLISISAIPYSNFYFFLTNAITAILLYLNLSLKITFSKLTFSRTIEILNYLPIVGASFVAMSIDRFLIKKVLDPTQLLVYAQYEVIAQGFVMLLLTVLFYYHKKILSDQRIRDKFKRLDRYLFPATVIFALTVVTIAVMGSKYFSLSSEFLLSVSFFKFTVLLVSYYIVFAQTEDKERSFGFYVVLIHILIFSLCFYHFISLLMTALCSVVAILGYVIIAKRI